MPYEHLNKTGRVRGLIFKVIRAVALKKKRFTLDDIPMPRGQAERNLQVLIKLGEVMRRKRAIRDGWRGVIPAIYERTSSLRSPELTNKLTHKRNDRIRITARAQSNLRDAAWNDGGMGSAERV